MDGLSQTESLDLSGGSSKWPWENHRSWKTQPCSTGPMELGKSLKSLGYTSQYT